MLPPEKHYSSYEIDKALNLLIGRRIIATSEDALILDNGMQLRFDQSNSECCTYIELSGLAAADNIIIAAKTDNNEDETGGEGAYRAWIQVVTEAGELNVAEADGDAGNGYYLHGFALGVTYEPAAPTDDEVARALASIRLANEFAQPEES